MNFIISIIKNDLTNTTKTLEVDYNKHNKTYLFLLYHFFSALRLHYIFYIVLFSGR